MPRVLAPLLTALLAWLAFPSVGIAPLAFVAWVPLLRALRGATPRRAFAHGALAGALMNGLGGAFLLPALVRESGLGAPIAALVFVAFATYQGARTALAAWLAARAAARGWALGPVFAIAATGLEAAFPLPFPWTFAAAVSSCRPLVQVADLGGATLVSFVLYAVNAGVAALLDSTWRARARALVGLAVLAAALAYGAARLAQVESAIAAAPRARVGLVHTERRAHDDADTPSLLEEVNALGRAGASLVVTSETSLPGVFPEEDLEPALRLAAGDRLEVPAIFGVVIGVVRPTNSAVTLSREGGLLSRYDKHRLLPFAEYAPFGEALPGLYHATRVGHFRAGGDRPRAPLVSESGALLHPAISICYEDTVPEVVRASARGATTNLLINLTNDAWFNGSSEAGIHLALARLRAVELRRTMVRSANLGHSAIIDPTGALVAERPSVEASTARSVLAEVPLLDEPTIYERAGEVPGWAALGLAIAFAFVRRPPESRPRRSAISPSAPS
ncbi:MAG: apolipoprotein N-acyltransferase [Polyangiaceae bacterium]